MRVHLQGAFGTTVCGANSKAQALAKDPDEVTCEVCRISSKFEWYYRGWKAHVREQKD